MNSFIYLEDESFIRKDNLEYNKSKKSKERRRRKNSKIDAESTIFKKKKNREKENLFNSSNHIRKYNKYSKNDLENNRKLKNIRKKIPRNETKIKQHKNNVLSDRIKGRNNKGFNHNGSFKNCHLSSDTGLADSMDQFNLLSSDPIEIDDSFYSYENIEHSEILITSEDYSNSNSELNDTDKSLFLEDDSKDDFGSSNIFNSFENEIENVSNQTIIVNPLENSHDIPSEINNTEKSFLIMDDNSNEKELTGIFAQPKIENLSFKELFNRSLQNGTAPKFSKESIEAINCHNNFNPNLYVDLKKSKSKFSENKSINVPPENKESKNMKKSLFSSDNYSNGKEMIGIFIPQKVENLSFKELFNRSLQNGTAPKFFNETSELVNSIPHSSSNIFFEYEKSKKSIRENNFLPPMLF